MFQVMRNCYVLYIILIHLNVIAYTQCIESNTLKVCINGTTGSISNISSSLGLQLNVSGYSWIGDNTFFDPNSIISTRVYSQNGDNIITVIRDILYKQYTLTLNDTYSVINDDKSTIEWELKIYNISATKLFSTSISTQLNFTNIESSDMYYWTMQSGPYSQYGSDLYQPFEDVLRLLNGTDINHTIYTQIGDGYVDKSIQFNTPNKSHRHVSVFPLTIFVSKSLSHGISLIYDINKDILLGGTMNINSEHQLFRRYYNRFAAETAPLTFTTYIRMNRGFGWRDTLNWTMSKFSNLFKPSGQPQRIQNIVQNAGLGIYSCAAAQDIDVVDVVNNSGANIDWDASFWYVYQGMSLPPTSNWSSYVGPQEQGYCGSHFKHGEESKRDKIASHYYNTSKVGITTVSYFNLFEWGEFVEWPLDINGVNITNEIWLNSSLYLTVYMNDSVVLDVNGNSIHEGRYKGIILDPGVESCYNNLVNQTYQHIDSFGDKFYGLGIDRQDWTSLFNHRRGDGYAVCKNANDEWSECASLLLSWQKIAESVGNIVHNEYMKNDAIITTNYVRQRMELLLITDIVFSEHSSLQNLNSDGLSTMGMHCIEWTYNATEVLEHYGGPHIYFQERLYLNVHSMAPVIGADHSPSPNATIQIYYNEYNLLFRALRGVTWWLLPNTIEIVNKNEDSPFINSFIDNQNNDIIIVAVMGYNLTENEMDVNIKIVGATSNMISCKTIYPGSENWNTAKVQNNVVTLPLKYGCGVARCMQ